MSNDDMPYDRTRERILSEAAAPPIAPPSAPTPEPPRPRDLTDDDRRQAAEWVASVKAARERCDAGDCRNRDCDDGRRCPFKHFKRGQR